MKSMFLSESNGEKSTIVPTENVVYQISTFEYQKNDENPNISSIDLGKCEQKLKTEYKIFANESLIIFKIDYLNKNKISRKCLFEFIFNSFLLIIK